MTASSFYAYEFVNKLILDAWCISDCCKNEIFRICHESVWKLVVQNSYNVMLCVFENESTLDSLSGHNLFFVIAKGSLLKICKLLLVCQKVVNSNRLYIQSIHTVLLYLYSINYKMIFYDNLLLYSGLYGVWPQYVGVTCLVP